MAMTFTCAREMAGSSCIGWCSEMGLGSSENISLSYAS
jgi:hypothetical protein